MELAQDIERIAGGDGPLAVDSSVACLADDVGIADDLRPDGGLEAGVAEAGVEVRLVGEG